MAMTWRRLLEFVREHEAAFGVIIGAFGVAAALASAAVALLQTTLLMNERATPYRTAVYVAQLEVVRKVAAAAIDYWSAEEDMVVSCEGLMTGAANDGWEDASKFTIERAGDSYYEFRRATLEGYTVLPDSVAEPMHALYVKLAEGAQQYGTGTCTDIFANKDWHDNNEESFYDLYWKFVNAARDDAKVDVLSARPALLDAKP